MIEVTYRGHPTFVSLFAQMLGEQGVDAQYAPPMESRSGDLARDVVVALTCNGAYDAIKAAVVKFKATRFGPAAVIQIHIDAGEGDSEPGA